MMTVAEPLSAGLMMMLGFCFSSLSAALSAVLRLSGTKVDLVICDALMVLVQNLRISSGMRCGVQLDGRRNLGAGSFGRSLKW